MRRRRQLSPFRSYAEPQNRLRPGRSLIRRVESRLSAKIRILMKTAITDLLSIRYPIVQGGMQWVARFYTSTGDGKEGVAAFLEKRKPVFADKASSARNVCPWD